MNLPHFIPGLGAVEPTGADEERGWRRGAHLRIAVGQQQADHDVQAEQLHAVQALLDAPQLTAQLLAPEQLPHPADVTSEGLPKIPAVGGRRCGAERCYGTWPAALL